MPTRDMDSCRTGPCPDAVFELLFSGALPSERHVEMLLDRLERKDAAPERRPGDSR